MSSRSSPRPRRPAPERPAPERQGPERGFTLLEVLCAFAILATLTGMLTVNFVQNVEKGVTALSHRELREAADTIFRKIIYEWEEYEDGAESTLDEIYGEFARLKGWQRDRWAIYRYQLEKKERTVVGMAEDSDDALFESQTGDEESSSAEGGETDVPGIKLVRIKLEIFRTDEAQKQALLTLVTWVDPEHGQVQNPR